MNRHCDHRWVRDDASTKQCLYCKTFAPVRGEA